MNDMSQVIIPKADQISADDLLAGPITIRITSVSIRPGTEQPVTINFEGDGGRPYKPCKSMCRCMVNCWGPDASKYIGAGMTLYRDPAVKWGGMEVGGIRISHMTGIERAITMALTATKGSKKAFVVKPLVMERAPAKAQSPTKAQSPAEWLADLEANLAAAETSEIVGDISARDDVRVALDKAPVQIKTRINVMIKAALDRTATLAPAADDGWPGDHAEIEG